eukprot:INCI11864.2.p1 GENE.INCI11864.2~~INCI11864.2.p1  ORF type:complete len:362 (+),score=49.18 INCI11864.2:197-1282(+)
MFPVRRGMLRAVKGLAVVFNRRRCTTDDSAQRRMCRWCQRRLVRAHSSQSGPLNIGRDVSELECSSSKAQSAATALTAEEQKQKICNEYIVLDPAVGPVVRQYDPSEARNAHAVFGRGGASFVVSIASESQLPSQTQANVHPSQEDVGRVGSVALAGRSNVGKSSLLNSLLLSKGLARSSKTPGRTQMLNYFQIGDAAAKLDGLAEARQQGSTANGSNHREQFPPLLHVVDLPGYGFAKAPKAVVAKWTATMTRFIQDAPSLNVHEVLVLVDSRHGILQADIDFISKTLCRTVGRSRGRRKNDSRRLQLVVPYSIVLTKADKVPLSKLRGRLGSTLGMFAPTEQVLTTLRTPWVFGLLFSL